MMKNTDEYVCCPLCKGTKKSPVKDKECGVCEGKGEITTKHAELLDRFKMVFKRYINDYIKAKEGAP